MIAPGKGAYQVPTERVSNPGSGQPGGSIPVGTAGDLSKAQRRRANARKRKLEGDAPLHQQAPASGKAGEGTGGKDASGKGVSNKGQGKQDLIMPDGKTQICIGVSKGFGPCAGQAAGSPSPAGRAHACTKCEALDHLLHSPCPN